MSARYVIVTLGSAGDLHPFLAIARELARRGEPVELLSCAPYEEAVRNEGVAFHAVCTEEDLQRTREHPRLWRPIDGMGVLWRYLAVPALRPTYERLRYWVKESGDSPVIVLASPLALGARVARDALPLRLLTGYTAPANLRSHGGHGYLGPIRVPHWMPETLQRGMWSLIDRYKLEPMARPALRKLRAGLGLATPTGATFGPWMHAPDGGIALFPEQFCPRLAGWPSDLQFAGFPVFEATMQSDLEARAPGLAAFLSQGTPPVVIYAGSAGTLGALVPTLTAAALQAGRRVVAIGAPGIAPGPGTSGQIFNADPEVLRLSDVLPDAALFVHHGGIGSCAQGLAHQVRQLIVPSGFDQFENAYRVERLNAGLNAGSRTTQVHGKLGECLQLPAPPALGISTSEPDTPNHAVKLACDILISQAKKKP